MRGRKGQSRPPGRPHLSVTAEMERVPATPTPSDLVARQAGWLTDALSKLLSDYREATKKKRPYDAVFRFELKNSGSVSASGVHGCLSFDNEVLDPVRDGPVPLASDSRGWTVKHDGDTTAPKYVEIYAARITPRASVTFNIPFLMLRPGPIRVRCDIVHNEGPKVHGEYAEGPPPSDGHPEEGPQQTTANGVTRSSDPAPE